MDLQTVALIAVIVAGIVLASWVQTEMRDNKALRGKLRVSEWECRTLERQLQRARGEPIHYTPTEANCPTDWSAP